jgi:hypothetical protein
MPLANLAGALSPYLSSGESNGSGSKFSIGGLSFGDS